MTPEGEVKAKARKAIHAEGLYTFPVNQQGIGRRGIPDDMMLINGTFYFIEYKVHMRWDANNKTALRTLPTVLQIIEMEKARAQGAVTLAVDDKSVYEFCQWIHEGLCYVQKIPMFCVWDMTWSDYQRYRDASALTARSMIAFPDGRHNPKVIR